MTSNTKLIQVNNANEPLVLATQEYVFVFVSTRCPARCTARISQCRPFRWTFPIWCRSALLQGNNQRPQAAANRLVWLPGAWQAERSRRTRAEHAGFSLMFKSLVRNFRVPGPDHGHGQHSHHHLKAHLKHIIMSTTHHQV